MQNLNKVKKYYRECVMECLTFLILGKYKRCFFKTTITVSFQFHHTQMDGAHAARFLNELQKEIEMLKV